MKYYYYVAKVDKETGAENLGIDVGKTDEIYVFDTEEECLNCIDTLKKSNEYPDYSLEVRQIHY